MVPGSVTEHEHEHDMVPGSVTFPFVWFVWFVVHVLDFGLALWALRVID